MNGPLFGKTRKASFYNPSLSAIIPKGPGKPGLFYFQNLACVLTGTEHGYWTCLNKVDSTFEIYQRYLGGENGAHVSNKGLNDELLQICDLIS